MRLPCVRSNWVHNCNPFGSHAVWLWADCSRPNGTGHDCTWCALTMLRRPLQKMDWPVVRGCDVSFSSCSLQWRHNDYDSVSNHQPHGCLLNRLFGRRSKKTSKLRVTGLCAGNSPGPVNSPHKGPVTWKMFPFDDVIMLPPNRCGAGLLLRAVGTGWRASSGGRLLLRIWILWLLYSPGTSMCVGVTLNKVLQP